MSDHASPESVPHPPQGESPAADRPSSASPLLQAQHLHKHYRLGDEDLHVLQGVDLAVSRGEWLAVLGTSGSGKSTLLHLLGGLDRPDAGGVSFEQTDLFSLRGRKLDEYRNARVGFVFQFYHLLPELTALGNVLLGAMIHHSTFAWPRRRREVRRRAVQLLDRVGLSGRLKHRPGRLSGGERQRVAIARALINEPAVLLADEPTGNLDAETGQHILDLFEELRRGGQTVVMVTHDAAIAAAADRRRTLVRGRLVAPDQERA